MDSSNEWVKQFALILIASLVIEEYWEGELGSVLPIKLFRNTAKKQWKVGLDVCVMVKDWWCKNLKQFLLLLFWASSYGEGHKLMVLTNALLSSTLEFRTFGAFYDCTSQFPLSVVLLLVL